MIGIAREKVVSQPDPADRCPYARPFPLEFTDCPTYQAVTFLATDSREQPLGAVVSCRHMTSATNPHTPGRFYPHCALGTADDRLKWLAQVRPERLEVTRALQQEFDRFSQSHREQLLEAKVRLVASPNAPELRQHVEQLLLAFRQAMRLFLDEREERFEQVGLPIGPLMQLFEEWSQAWLQSRQPGSAGFSDSALRAFTPQSQAFLRPAAESPWRAGRDGSGEMADDHRATLQARVFASGILRISPSSDPPGLIFSGDIDASNVHRVAQSLAGAAVAAGDFHLDLSGVLFCDLGGLRAIVRASNGLPAGQRLVLHGMPASLKRVVPLVGWGALPNLVIEP